ncbi:MAG: sulfatase-like hydrolase/transferase [Phycisphaerae bacterium]|nr:sulfatase-like hydrolase/transferase [Phycisphaerae bacterium]
MATARCILVSWLAVGALGLAVMPASMVRAAEQTDPGDRPNVILCMADDQGWGDVGYNGHPRLKTPTLDTMAATGLRFTRFYAAAPVCSPTRGSVMTGRHPNRYGCFSWGYTLRPQEITVAEALKAAGYVTGHFGKWHLGPVRADSPVCPGNSGFDEWFSSPNFYENDPLMSHRGKVVQTKGESSQVTAEAALKFIRQAVSQKRPFLAVIWFGSPHSPHQAVAEDREPYKDLPPKLQHYLGEITGIDRAMGRLRGELRELGVAENTLLWYTSDNGARAPGSTGGLSGHKGNLWEGGIRVPAIIEWPARISSPRQVDVPCGTVDIYPTLSAIIGIKVPNQPQPLDGIDLLPVIDGKLTERPRPMGFWVYPAKGIRTPSAEILQAMADEQRTGSRPAASAESHPATDGIAKRYSDKDLPGHAAWIDGNYKLHRIPRKAGKVDEKLFDLAADPKEQQDLAARDPDRAGRMSQALLAWQRSVVKSLNGQDYLRP